MNSNWSYIAISGFKLELHSGNFQFGSKSAIFCPVGLEIWQMTSKNNRVPFLCYLKLCASFHNHRWLQTWVTVRKRSIWVKIGNVFFTCDLEIWRMTLKKNRTTFLCYFKLCASFNSHQWIQARVTVRKRPIWIKIGDFFVPCDLEIRWMTLKNNRAPFLHHFKLCASFRSHL